MVISDYVYRCSAGESFDSVALVMFGSEQYAPEILTLNPEESHKAIFSGGEILRLPVIDLPEEDGTDTIVVPDKAPWKE